MNNNKTFNPCDECKYSYSKQNQESNMCKICEFKAVLNVLSKKAHPLKQIKQTNAERIRSMSDEELAMIMMCPNENGLAEIECDKSDSCNCYECLLKWLQSEVEEKNETD